jgi:hypothetical protein
MSNVTPDDSALGGRWSQERLRRLGELAREQRLALGYSVDGLAALPDGPGSTMISDLESGRRLPAKASSIERYERALKIGPQSFARILGGEDEFRPMSAADRAVSTVTLLDNHRAVEVYGVVMDEDDPLRPIVAALAALTPNDHARLADIAGRWMHHRGGAEDRQRGTAGRWTA